METVISTGTIRGNAEGRHAGSSLLRTLLRLLLLLLANPLQFLHDLCGRARLAVGVGPAERWDRSLELHPRRMHEAPLPAQADNCY